MSALVAILLAVVAGFGWRALHRPTPIIVAFANSMSGPVAGFGEEARVATQLYLDQVNATGGVDGHPVELRIFDDQSKPVIAETNVPAILRSPALAVLGHSISATSAVAGPRYRTAHIAAIAGNASSDELTRANPYYFQAMSTNSDQAEFLANYMRAVLKPTNPSAPYPDAVDLVTNDTAYGRSFRAGFARRAGGAEPKPFVVRPGRMFGESVKAAVDLLAAEPEPRTIIIGVAPDIVAPVLKAIRRRGIDAPVIVPSGVAVDSFAVQFASEPEEHARPGFFTDNVFAVAPMILDSTGELGQTLAAQYEAATGKRAGWIAAAAQDSTRLLVEALRRAHVSNTEGTRLDDREKIRAALAGIDSPSSAVPGINGALYFNTDRNMPRPLRYGQFQAEHFLSAPLQLVRGARSEASDVGQNANSDRTVQIGGAPYSIQRVVYTGIDIIHLNRVDVRDGTFNAEFYLWMRYGGEDDSPTKIEFSGFLGSFDPTRPLQSERLGGLNYRLYRLSGNFKGNFDLHDYPFDRQGLLIHLQNRDYARDQVFYVVDTAGLRSGPQAGGASGDDDAFRDLQLWHVLGIRSFVDSFSIRSTLGKPTLFSTADRTEYGGFATEVSVQRNALAFMIKTLIAPMLLLLVVFATLFFPPGLAKERTTIPVTGILTSAVLLISISNQLPVLGYTVTLEYIFYVFFALCLMSMATGALSEILRHRQRAAYVATVDVVGRLIYVLTVLVTVGVIWWKYAGGSG